MITHLWVAPFLEALEKTGNYSAAAKIAGIHRTTIYKHRMTDDDFGRACDEALEVATEFLELEARRRALQGWENPVFYRGVEVGKIREYSDALMMFLLRAHRPAKYRENMAVEHAGEVTLIDLVSEAEKRAEDRRRERTTDGATE